MNRETIPLRPSDRYAVIGHPIAHSKSPIIHQLFAGQTGQSISYEAMDVSPEEFDDAIKTFFANGGHGLNVTVPHKARAMELMDQLTPAAKLAGAVNTITSLPKWQT